MVVDAFYARAFSYTGKLQHLMPDADIRFIGDEEMFEITVCDTPIKISMEELDIRPIEAIAEDVRRMACLKY